MRIQECEHAVKLIVWPRIHPFRCK